MFRQEYEERLVRQLSIKEGRPFQAALPVSAGFSGSSVRVCVDFVRTASLHHHLELCVLI
jgi:hypothetical protein